MMHDVSDRDMKRLLGLSVEAPDNLSLGMEERGDANADNAPALLEHRTLAAECRALREKLLDYHRRNAVSMSATEN
jgi:hypothetical protein